MIKKGIIMEHNNHIAVMFTESGEFIKFKTTEKLTIGQEYVYKKSTNFKPFLMAASLFIVVLLTTFISMYNQVYASMTVTINPQFKIDINRFNRIIRVTPLNNDAKKIIKNIKIKNKKIDDGLLLIVNKAKDEKYITNAYYNNSSKAIKIETNNPNISLIKFTTEMKKQKINIENVYLKLQKLQEKQRQREEFKDKIETKKQEIKDNLNQKRDKETTSKIKNNALPNPPKNKPQNSNEKANENNKSNNIVNHKKNDKNNFTVPKFKNINRKIIEDKIKVKNNTN